MSPKAKRHKSEGAAKLATVELTDVVPSVPEVAAAAASTAGAATAAEMTPAPAAAAAAIAPAGEVVKEKGPAVEAAAAKEAEDEEKESEESEEEAEEAENEEEEGEEGAGAEGDEAEEEDGAEEEEGEEENDAEEEEAEGEEEEDGEENAEAEEDEAEEEEEADEENAAAEEDEAEEKEEAGEEEEKEKSEGAAAREEAEKFVAEVKAVHDRYMETVTQARNPSAQVIYFSSAINDLTAFESRIGKYCKDLLMGDYESILKSDANEQRGILDEALDYFHAMASNIVGNVSVLRRVDPQPIGVNTLTDGVLVTAKQLVAGMAKIKAMASSEDIFADAVSLTHEITHSLHLKTSVAEAREIKRRAHLHRIKQTSIVLEAAFAALQDVDGNPQQFHGKKAAWCGCFHVGKTHTFKKIRAFCEMYQNLQCDGTDDPAVGNFVRFLREQFVGLEPTEVFFPTDLKGRANPQLYRETIARWRVAERADAESKNWLGRAPTQAQLDNIAQVQGALSLQNVLDSLFWLYKSTASYRGGWLKSATTWKCDVTAFVTYLNKLVATGSSNAGDVKAKTLIEVARDKINSGIGVVNGVVGIIPARLEHSARRFIASTQGYRDQLSIIGHTVAAQGGFAFGLENLDSLRAAASTLLQHLTQYERAVANFYVQFAHRGADEIHRCFERARESLRAQVDMMQEPAQNAEVVADNLAANIAAVENVVIGHELGMVPAIANADTVSIDDVVAGGLQFVANLRDAAAAAAHEPAARHVAGV